MIFDMSGGSLLTCVGERMNSQPTLLPQIMAALAIGLFAGVSSSSAADERAAALDKAIPSAMERASIPGAIVGIWQDG